MPKLLAPPGCIEIDTGSRKYAQQRDGTLHVDRNDQVRLLKKAGCTVAGTSLAGSRVASFRCEPCEFTTVFTVCGRCGRPTVKET